MHSLHLPADARSAGVASGLAGMVGERGADGGRSCERSVGGKSICGLTLVRRSGHWLAKRCQTPPRKLDGSEPKEYRRGRVLSSRAIHFGLGFGSWHVAVHLPYAFGSGASRADAGRPGTHVCRLRGFRCCVCCVRGERCSEFREGMIIIIYIIILYIYIYIYIYNYYIYI